MLKWMLVNISALTLYTPPAAKISILEGPLALQNSHCCGYKESCMALSIPNPGKYWSLADPEILDTQQRLLERSWGRSKEVNNRDN